MATNSNLPWTDAELRAATEAYVFLLRAERYGLRLRGEAPARAMLGSSLKERNEASIRYRMRNISSVVSEYGIPTLSTYSPADRAGVGVASRIRAILNESAEFGALLGNRDDFALYGGPPALDAREEALTRLGTLREFISTLEATITRGGHNHPPETLLSHWASRSEFQEAYESIDALANELSKDTPDTKATERHSNVLLGFGLKAAAWLGQRATKFTDATLTVLAPAIALQVSGLAPMILETLATVARALLPH